VVSSGADHNQPFQLRVPVALGALAIGAVSLLLARGTLMPGLGFWDTGEFQTVPPLLGTAHPTGFPTYVILGWLASIVLQPFGDPAFRMNLLSGFCVAGASGLSVILVVQLTRRTWLAIAAGLVFATTPIAWQISNHADAHALHILLVVILVVLLVGWEQRVRANAPTRDRWLLAAAVLYGVALGNHTLIVLYAPGIAFFVHVVEPGIWRRRRRFFLTCAGAVVLTAGLLYLELPLRAGLLRAPLVYGHPETLDGLRYIVFAEQFQGTFSGPLTDLPGKLGDLVQFGFDQLGPLAVLVPFGYVAAAVRHPRYALLTGVTFLITVWFASSYVNAEIGRYYLGPALMAVTWVAILGDAFLEQLWRLFGLDETLAPPGERRSSVRPDVVGSAVLAAFMLELAVAGSLATPAVEAVPDRWNQLDLSNETTASTWVHTAMSLFEPNAVVLSWWSYSTTLWYAQLIEGLRPDVWIIDDRTRLDEHLGDVSDVIDAQLGKRPVYLIRLNPDELAELGTRYQLEPIDMPTDQQILHVIGRLAP
jgi:Protein of unknown function (DUF2723)